MVEYRPTSSDLEFNAIVALVSFFVFWCVYFFAWKYLIPTSMAQIETPLKADYCTRWCSSVHAIACIIGVSICLLTNHWTKETIAFESDALCRTVFSITIGYFLQDGVVLVRHRMPLYEVFIAHHIIAIIPYFMNNFFCEHGTLVLASFLLVEIPTIPYNIVTMIEFCGKESMPLYRYSYLVLFVTWIIFRIIMPLILLILVFAIIIPEWFYGSYRPDSVLLASFCVLPSAVSAHLITAFCWYVFFSLLIKNFTTVWIMRRRTGSTGERSALFPEINESYASVQNILYPKEPLGDQIA